MTILPFVSVFLTGSDRIPVQGMKAVQVGKRPGL